MSDSVSESIKAFRLAKVKFQKDCPPIKKDKEVLNKDGSVRYRFASLPSIRESIKDVLADNGFSYWWTDGEGDEKLLVTCHLDHVEGHSESSTFPVNLFAGYGTNRAQDGGSANTFGRRYSLANVLGLVVDEDDDGAGAAMMNSEFLVHHNNTARDWLPSILATKDALAENNLEAAAECIAEMPLKVFKTLWVAPSSGGLWTTGERKLMKEDQDFKRLVYERRKDSGWFDDPNNQM